MNLKQYFTIQTLLEKDNLEEALHSFKCLVIDNDIRNSITANYGRWSELRKSFSEGVISKQEETLQKNRIRKSLLSILQEIKEDCITKEEEDFYYLKTAIGEVLHKLEVLYKDISSRSEQSYTWITDFRKDLDDINSKWKAQTFTVSVIALMKSGKSTLLNSWMGNEYLSTSIKPETIRVVRIQHSSNAGQGVLRNKEKKEAEGPINIKSKLKSLNKYYRDRDIIPSDEELTLQVNLPAFVDRDFNDIKFELLDTPGVNEAGVESLVGKIDRLVHNSDVIIYLLDATKLKSKDEEEMFLKLKEDRKELFQFLDTKLFFVVNKIDELEDRNMIEAKGFDNVESIKKYIANYLNKKVGIKEVSASDIFTVSAERALLGRAIIGGNPTPGQVNDFMRKAFGDTQELWRYVTEEIKIQKAHKYIIQSSIQDLEKNILDKIHEKRISIFSSTILLKLNSVVQQRRSDMEVTNGTLTSKVVEIESLKRDMEIIKERLSELSVINNNFKKKGNSKVDDIFGEFQEAVYSEINSAFKKDQDTVYNNYLPEGLAKVLRTTNYNYKHENINEVKRKLHDINYQVLINLNSHFNKIWNQISIEIKKYHDIFSEELEETVDPLVEQIEEKIEEELDIKIHKRKLRIPHYTPNEFYAKINNSLNSLIQKKKKLNPKIKKEKYVAKKDRYILLGLIKTKSAGQVYTKTYIEWFDTSYNFSSKSYKNFLLKQIGELCSNTSNIVKQVINQEFEKVKFGIENEVIAYAERYIQNIENELAVKDGGEDINLRKERVKGDILAIDNLLRQLSQVKRKFKIKY